MTPEEFDNWCQVGRRQREEIWPEDLVPILALITPTGIEIQGLIGPAELWPGAFEAFRKAKHPTDAVLTSDSHYRTYDKGEAVHDRPKEDPRAVDAVVVLSADGKARAMPYSVHDDGSFDWLEEEPNAMHFGAVSAALQAMVRP